MKADTRKHYEQVQQLAEKIAGLCQDEVVKLGFDTSVQLRAPDEAKFHLEKDPLNGEMTLVGSWLDKRGFKQGMLVFHHDGSFYVEQDIVRDHPKKKKWFVEAINAWGRGEDIKVEAKLMPLPG